MLTILILLAAVIVVGTQLDGSTQSASSGKHNPVRGIVAAGVDGRLLTVLYDDRCLVHDLDSATSYGLWLGSSRDERIQVIAASPVENRVALYHSDGYLDLVDAKTGEILWERSIRREQASCMKFSPDGETIAVGTGDGNLFVIDARSGDIRRHYQGDVPANALCFTADGRQIVLPLPGDGLGFYDLATGTIEERMAASARLVSHLTASPDGRTLAAGTLEGTLILWDLDTGRELARKMESYFPLTEVAFSPNGQSILSASCDGRLRTTPLSGLTSGRTVHAHNEAISELEFSGDWLLSGGHDGNIRAWNIETMTERPLELP